MKFELSVRDTFEAGHFLPGHPKCGHQHGHCYEVEVTFEGYTLNEQSMVLDFDDCKMMLNKLIKMFDHKNLNDFFDMPTCEILAKYMWSQLVDTPVIKITVHETADTKVTIQPEMSIPWIVGFLEGEGSFTYRVFKVTDTDHYSAQPMIVISQKEREVLDKIRDVLLEYGISATVSAQTGSFNVKICGYKSCWRFLKRARHWILSKKKLAQLEMFEKVFLPKVRGKYVANSRNDVKLKLEDAGWVSTRWSAVRPDNEGKNHGVSV